MKKIFALVFSALFTMTMLTSCVTAEAATVAVEAEYYDYGYNYVVVYIDGIANYRFWDDLYRRYYYYPVPHDRFGYIRVVPHGHRPMMRPLHRHHNVMRPSQRPHRPGSDMNRRPDRRPEIHHRSSTYQSGRPGMNGNRNGGNLGGRPSGSRSSSSTYSHSSRGHFGGRR